MNDRAVELAAYGGHSFDRGMKKSQGSSGIRPIGGDFAFVLFSAGIIGTGLRAVPVLAGSAAYAIAESHG